MSKKNFANYGSNESIIDIDSAELSEDTIGDAVAQVTANFGAPNQMYVSSHALHNLTQIMKIHYHPIMERIYAMLHGGLKLGKISWDDNNAVECAAEALEKMGFFKYANKE